MPLGLLQKFSAAVRSSTQVLKAHSSMTLEFSTNLPPGVGLVTRLIDPELTAYILAIGTKVLTEDHVFEISRRWGGAVITSSDRGTNVTIREYGELGALNWMELLEIGAKPLRMSTFAVPKA